MYYETLVLASNGLAPLFVYITMGYIGGRVIGIDRSSISNFLFYLVNPIVFFYNISQANLSQALILVPIIFFIISCITCLAFYYAGKKIWRDDTPNLLGLAAGTGNTGYMMLPIIYAFFGEEHVSMLFLIIIGIAFYENTLGFYISAYGHYSAKQSLLKLLKLPALYAFLLAIIVLSIGYKLPEPVKLFSKNMSSLYSVLGMMVIGLNIAEIRNYRIDLKFMTMAYLARYLAWPLATFFFVVIDRQFFQIFDEKTHALWMVLAFIPMGVNSMIIATILKNKPEKVATAVLISTISALLYVPLAIVCFLK
jgi:predicted permease